MLHLDLFSGIGGFALAARWLGIQTTQFVELDPYCQKVLARNFPGVPIHGDIRTYTAKPGDFDLVTFGSPCQDISVANQKGRGLDGERSGLFYEAIRIVRLVRPRFAVFENVAGILTKDKGIHFERVLRAFWESGYDAEWQIVSAASVGAPHLRERVFVVAYSSQCECRGIHGGIPTFEPQNQGEINANPDRSRFQKLDSTPIAIRERRSARLFAGDATDSQNWIPQNASKRIDDPHKMGLGNSCSYWQRIPAPEPTICRVDDGVPNRMADRRNVIHGLGNAVVPQVARIPLLRVLELASATPTPDSGTCPGV